MKSIFLASVALYVLSVVTKDATCKSLGSIEKKSVVFSEEVTSNNLSSSSIEKVFRTKRNIVTNTGCPLNTKRIIACIAIRKLKLEKNGKRKNGLHKSNNT